MVDRDLILSKAGLAEKYINRAIQKGRIDLSIFMKDIDCQDIVIFNLQKAIQGCIDMAAHIISDEDLGLPGSTNEMFYLLEDSGYLDRDLTEKMVQAVGFRNLIAHEYEKLDLERVYKVAQKDILDLHAYIKAILRKIA
ncbi:DUF86 domain-containing protein [Thermodesulfobacteriota bacterium]